MHSDPRPTLSTASPLAAPNPANFNLKTFANRSWHRFRFSDLIQGIDVQWKTYGLMLLAFVLVRAVLFKPTRLPETAYFSYSLLLASLTHFPAVIAWCAITVLMWTGWNRISWSELESGYALRTFIAVVAGTLAWTFSVYDYNLYYNQGHYIERLALVLLFVGSFWKPVLIAPFLGLVYLITHQFDQPVACTWTDKRVLFDVLALFVGFQCLRVWLPEQRTKVTSNEFLFFVLCLHASNYFFPGWGKLISGWPLIERIDNLFIASYLNGWMGFLTEKQAIGWASFIATWNFPMVWGSMILELGLLFCFWNRRVCMILLAGCVVLHGMICLTTGILFWKWIILDIALIAVLGIRNPQLNESLFSKSRRWPSAILIALAPFYFSPMWLSWFDTELNEIYHLQVVTTSGKTLNVPRTLMTPYEVYFAQDKFHFLLHDKLVNGRYGTTSIRDVALALDGRPTPQLAERVREKFGQTEFNAARGDSFQRFLTQYFRNLNERQTVRAVPGVIQPPQHIYSIVPEPRFDGREKVASIRVIHVRSLYRRDKIETMKHEVIREYHLNEKHSGAQTASRSVPK